MPWNRDESLLPTLICHPFLHLSHCTRRDFLKCKSDHVTPSHKSSMDPCNLLGKIHTLVMTYGSSTAWPLSAPKPHLSPHTFFLSMKTYLQFSEYPKISQHSFPFYSLIFQLEKKQTKHNNALPTGMDHGPI